jgi:hypothetical protein
MTSDRRGNAFLSGSYQDQSSGKELNARVMRRPIGGGTWVPDTVGLDPSIHYFNSMIPGKNGEVYGAVGHNLFRRATNGVWSRISLPSASGFSSITCLAVDSSGALFTGFFGGAGVYFTTNNGSAWTLAGASGVTPSSLVSYGDTTYALTSGHGVIVLTRTTTSVPPSAGVTMPGSYALYQNYPDPFNPSTRIEYRVSQRSLVSLRVYNVLGQEVTTLVNETKDPGTYSVAWDAKSRSSGAYFYRLVAGSFVDTKKMVLMR